MSPWKSRLAIVAATVVLASWFGYRSERRSMDAAGKPAATFRSVVRQVMAPKSRKDSFARLHQIRHTSGRSQPTPREMQQCWEIVRGFTVEDVQAYLAEIPDGLRRPVNGALVSMLFYRWAQMDPEAAMNAVNLPPYEKMSDAQYAAAAAWIDRDMAAAMRWAVSHGSSDAADLMAHATGKIMALQDPDHALARAKAEFPDAVDGVISALTERYSGDKGSRRKLFEILDGLDDPVMERRGLNQLAWCYEGDREQALAAIAELEGSGLLAEQVKTFRENLVNRSMYDRPQERLEFVMQPEANADARMQTNAYATWMWREPEQATRWAEEHDRVDFIAEMVKRQSFEQIRSGWQPGDKSQVAWEDGLRHQIGTWKRLQPEAADAWLQSLPADIRNHMTPSQADATHE